ncbi:MAG: hypothetical protein V1787_00490 [Candidatus Micrarchaeota archaeon]
MVLNLAHVAIKGWKGMWNGRREVSGHVVVRGAHTLSVMTSKYRIALKNCDCFSVVSFPRPEHFSDLINASRGTHENGPSSYNPVAVGTAHYEIRGGYAELVYLMAHYKLKQDARRQGRAVLSEKLHALHHGWRLQNLEAGIRWALENVGDVRIDKYYLDNRDRKNVRDSVFAVCRKKRWKLEGPTEENPLYYTIRRPDGMADTPKGKKYAVY